MLALQYPSVTSILVGPEDSAAAILFHSPSVVRGFLPLL